MTTFTAPQITLIKAAIAANPTMANATNDDPGSQVIQNILNATDAAWFVWRSSTPAGDIGNAIVWANMTPSDAADITAMYTNRALYSQAKQISLQTMIQGRETINTGLANIRAGLQDCLTNLPNGLAGATIAAGWTAVKTAITRNATALEKVLSTGTGSAATPATLGFEGTVSLADVSAIRAAP